MVRARQSAAPPPSAADEPPGRISWSALAAGVTGGTVAVLYVSVIVGQEGDTWRTAAPFATVLAIGVAAALFAALVPIDEPRLGAAAVAAAVFLGGMILGALSIGALLLPPSLCALACISSTGARLGVVETTVAAAAAATGALAIVMLWN